MTRSLLEDRRTIWIVGAFTIVLFLVANLPWHLDNFDQAKQAYTSFEMVELGHWFFQHTPLQAIATKPPLAGWIVDSTGGYRPAIVAAMVLEVAGLAVILTLRPKRRAAPA